MSQLAICEKAESEKAKDAMERFHIHIWQGLKELDWWGRLVLGLIAFAAIFLVNPFIRWMIHFIICRWLGSSCGWLARWYRVWLPSPIFRHLVDKMSRGVTKASAGWRRRLNEDNDEW